MKKIAGILIAATLMQSASAETADQLQQKFQSAQAEIVSLKAKIAVMQNQVEQAQSAHQLQPTRPLDQALTVEHPIVTAYELASYGQADKAAVGNLTRGKVVSVTGRVDRFGEGFGRGFHVFLDTSGSSMQVECSFNAASSVSSTYTAEEGSKMVIEDQRRGRYTLTSINENVVISGWLQKVGPRRVTLVNCLLQKQ